VVCIAGDGSTYDIGFGALSGMLDREDDVLYITYDNEQYANTGVQKSGATPFGASTTTSQVGIVHQGKEKERKPIVEIAASHNIPYAASASIAFLADSKMKLKKAASIHGPRFLAIHAPCALGAGFDGGLSMKVARLAVQTRMWFLFEIENGKFRLNFDPQNQKPVGEYLQLQKRFSHVTPEMEAVIQKKADKNYERFSAWNNRDNQPAGNHSHAETDSNPVAELQKKRVNQEN
jgi:pyruvate ferredoxin oxidoreductase beta subunit